MSDIESMSNLSSTKCFRESTAISTPTYLESPERCNVVQCGAVLWYYYLLGSTTKQERDGDWERIREKNRKEGQNERKIRREMEDGRERNEEKDSFMERKGEGRESEEIKETEK